MSIDLKFFKTDSKIPWGFRLVGGSDVNQPLIVVKVKDDSIAENCGLIIGDLIVRINDTPTAGLTHEKAYELIHAAGNEMTVAIRRGLIADVPFLPDDDNNSEIETILGDSTEDASDCECQFKLADVEKNHPASPKPLVNDINKQNCQEDTCEAIVAANERKSKLKKWSTFLVKPKNPKPISKKIEEQIEIVGEPYRVKIVKQKRRNPDDVLNHKKTVQFALNKESESNQVLNNDQSDTIEGNEELCKTLTEEVTKEENEHHPIEDKDFETIEDDSLECELQHNETDDDNDDDCDDDTVQQPKSILKSTLSETEQHDEEDSVSISDQLLAVQKQLLALSQLPSAIQETLEAVTQQLNKIVVEKGIVPTDANEKDKSDAEESDADLTYEATQDEIPSVSENAEEDITENEADENQNIEDLEEDNENKDSTEKETEDSLCNEVETLTEEELQKQMEEERSLAKKLKEEEENRKKDWTQRPIILPGGKKWTDPDDAIPKIRIPKMSDEKICKTIEGFSEVITGKTKGINFLKYQPPPKSLEYLQKSEVYRVIHGIEPPIKGVGARAEKVLSENDYYRLMGAV